jgi:uncharacterized membrane protein
MIEFLYSVFFPSILAALGWGIAPIFDKKAISILEKDYQTLFIIKMIFTGIITLIYYLMTKKIDFNDKKIRKSLIYIFAAAIFASLMGHFFYYKALSMSKYTTSVVLLTYILPLIFVALLSRIFLKEKINLGMVVGMIICLTGIGVFIKYSELN